MPLCATHHQQVHTTTKEREWWQERNIDPLIVARALWRESRGGAEDEAAADEESVEPKATQSQKQASDSDLMQPTLEP